MIKKTFKFLAPYIKPYILRIILGIIANLGAVLSLAFIPRTIQQTLKILEKGIDPANGESILVLCAVKIIVAALAAAIFGFAARQFIIRSSRQIEYKIRNDFYLHLLSLSVQNLESKKIGDIMSRSIDDISDIRMMIGQAIMFLSRAIFIAPVAIILMVMISWKLTLLALLPLIGITIVTKLFGNSMYRISLKIREIAGDISSKAQENFSNVKLIAAYAQTDYEIDEFRNHSARFKSEQIRFAKFRGIFHALLGTLANLGVLLFVIFSPGVVFAGGILVSDAFAFFAYQEMLIWPMTMLGWTIMMIQRGAASVKRFTDIFEEVSMIKSPENGIDSEIKDTIEFKNVSFAYKNNVTVLDNVSFKISAGEKIGILGSVGSGKTTIANLIPRLYDVTSGSILVDGIDVREYDLKHLRKNIGYAPQDSFLFSQSISENISYGFENPFDDKQLKEFTKIAALDNDEDQFPEGFQTVIGERGVSLSGGQKQRTALARALAIKPKILILDDTFSAVDSETESTILQNFQNVLKDLLVIIISHRVSTVSIADRIIVLHEGKIAEQGTHAELEKLGGIYSRIAHKQKIQSELEIM